MSRIDLHSHTKGSDGSGSPEAIALAAREAGLDGLVLCDHHQNVSQECADVANALRKVGVLPIVGCEYSCKQGHLQVFGVDVSVGAYGMYPEMQRVIDDVNALGGACVVPHCYKRGYKGFVGDDIFKITGLAAMEGYNGQVEVDNPHTNKLAREAAAKLGLPMTGASDAHRPSYVGLAYTEFEATITDEAGFIAALKSGKFTAQVNADILRRLRTAQAARWESFDLGEGPANFGSWERVNGHYEYQAKPRAPRQLALSGKVANDPFARATVSGKKG